MSPTGMEHRQRRAAGRTVAALLAARVTERDFAWLQEALQLAIQLELATLPPYLTARWTIKDLASPVASSIRTIYLEEMLHLGLACNLLVAIGGTPVLASPGVVPAFPGPLPGGVRPGLTVSLRALTHEQVQTFMEIEYPQGGPIAFAAPETFDSIGAFYDAILDAFERLTPALSLERQRAGSLGLSVVGSPAQVREAIGLIKRQGEGSRLSPDGPCFRLVGAGADGGKQTTPPGDRWARVRAILDAATGSDVPFHDGHGRFWNATLAEFVALTVYGQPLVATPGPQRGRRSNLVKALRGEAPFDGGQFPRMPLDRPAVSPEDVEFIERWIDDGCPGAD